MMPGDALVGPDYDYDHAEAVYDERLRLALCAAVGDPDTLEDWLLLVLKDGDERDRQMLLGKMTAELGERAAPGGYGTQSVAEYVAVCVVNDWPRIVDDLEADR